MKLRPLAALAAVPLLVLLVAPTSAASAADKEPHAGVPYSFTLDAGDACDFPVMWSGIDDETYTVRPDGSVYVQGYYDGTITNLANGKHVFRVASGPGLFLPGGNVLRAHGTWIVNTPQREGHKARLVLITGSFKIALNKGNIYGAKPGTTVVNLCKLLS